MAIRQLIKIKQAIPQDIKIDFEIYFFLRKEIVPLKRNKLPIIDNKNLNIIEKL
jgi:hypothetical protein